MKKKSILWLIIGIILFIGASIAIYLHTKEEEELSITGRVLISGDSYIMLETDDEDYIINDVYNAYEVGDEVTIIYEKSSLKSNKNPKEITAKEEKIVKLKEEVTDTPSNNNDTTSNETNDTTNNNNPNSNNTTNNSNNSNNNTTNTNPNNDNNNTSNNNTSNTTNNKSADEAVLEYVRKIESDTNNGITDTLKSGFITTVDFLFYNGKIAGHTFSELTTSAKLEVLKAGLWIDAKVDSIFPGYKETISNGASKVYTSVKNLIVSTYLDITTSICNANSSLCTEAKEDFQDLKTSFGFTWDLIKDLASSGVGKLKNWYEIWSGK